MKPPPSIKYILANQTPVRPASARGSIGEQRIKRHG